MIQTHLAYKRFKDLEIKRAALYGAMVSTAADTSLPQAERNEQLTYLKSEYEAADAATDSAYLAYRAECAKENQS